MKHLRSGLSAYVTLKIFTPGLQKIYTDISAISAIFQLCLRDCVTQRTQCDPKDTEPTLAWPLHTPVSMSFMDCLLFKEHFFPAYFQ